MTASARDSLIAICVLWVLVTVVVFLRLLGRHRGFGIGADDILSVVALVSYLIYHELELEGNG